MNGIIKIMKIKLFNEFGLFFVFCFTISLVGAPLPSNAYIDAIFEQLKHTGLTDHFDEGELSSMMKQAEDFDRYMREVYNLDAMLEKETYLIFNPTNPSAGETVQVAIKSDVDFNRSVMTWYLDGNLQESDYGLRFFNFSAGEVGETSTIKVDILTDSGIRKNASIQIAPAEVDIFWQANTYAPAFYQGKKLTPSSDKGIVEFIALPKFIGPDAVENPDNYVFSWKVNNRDVRGASGRGRNTLVVDLSDTLSRASVLVEVTRINTGQKATGRIPFPRSGNPEILIYTEDKYGIDYSRAINHFANYSPKDQNLWLVATPFFFGDREKRTLSASWFMNKQIIPDFENLDRAHFSIDRGFTGRSSVSVKMKNLENTRENATAEVMFTIR